MASVLVHQLVKSFNNVHAVHDVGFKVNDGEFVFFLGPSGCGKTTTLRMIAGLLMPTSGRIEIGGRNVTFLRPRHRNVGMVFQQNVLYPHMSVADNLAYPLKVRGFTRKEVREKLGEVAERLRIADVLDRMPDELSGGQSQRVAIGRMLVRQADVFLMDEAISHLDAKLRAHMRTELRHLQKTLGVTTLFVSHDQLEAMSMGDRILVMNDGAIQQFGTPQEVFDRPANRFVAGFVGEPHMNILPAEIRHEGARPVARWAGGAMPLPDLPHGLVEGSLVDVGIRPEHVVLAAPSRTNAGHGNVEALEPLGAECLVTVQAGGQTLRARLPAVRADRLGFDVGAAVSLQFPRDHIYLFDKAGGQTLLQAGFTEELRLEAA
ncbi:ABC transporter ATP-binding protein [Variovorax rhizosphaerae]|uniref:ABC transporter ATP-binding protein n=1 Tax=Variovorax rhizosphaerae TaxID=1836200 RepID=A0ABU8WDK4_9BURK